MGVNLSPPPTLPPMGVNLSPPTLLQSSLSQDQSYGKLLGADVHLLENIIDEGISLDVSNISFSHFKCDQL